MSHITDPIQRAGLVAAWESLLDAPRIEGEVALMTLSQLIARQLIASEEVLITTWLPKLIERLPRAQQVVAHDPRVATFLATHLATTHSVQLSDAGKLLAWCELFSSRADVKARVQVTPAGNDKIARLHAQEAPASYRALAMAWDRFELSWRFTRGALRQAHRVPARLRDALTARKEATAHGGIVLDLAGLQPWREERSPNTWKTVDYNAREALLIGHHSLHSCDDLYLIAASDSPRSDAYVSATSHVDGGNFGGIPACMTHTRYRDLTTLLRMGARRGFAQDWTLIEPEDQDFGDFAQLEREVFIPEYFARDPDEEAEPCDEVEEVLRLRSAPRDAGAQELHRRLVAQGASPFVASALYQWLHEAASLLLER